MRRLYGIAGVASRVDARARSARLTERRDDPVSGFSRGMRQRLALERALLHDPRLVLLDEPFTGLDDASAAALVERLRDLRSGGAIVLLATHDLEVIEDLDRSGGDAARRATGDDRRRSGVAAGAIPCGRWIGTRQAGS